MAFSMDISETYVRQSVVAPEGTFIEYLEPNLVEILIFISFFFLLSISEWISSKVFKVGPIGQMIVGMLYGVPIGNILTIPMQQVFVGLGYIGLVLIMFEGGLTLNLDSMKGHYRIVIFSGTVALMVPMAVSFGFLYAGLDYGAVETFIVGAALSATSLSHTFLVIHTVVKDYDFSRTRIGTILIGAVVLNDMVGLVTSPETDHEKKSLATAIWRPIVAAIGIAIVMPLLTKYLFGPVFRWYVEPYFVRFKHVSNITLMVFTLAAFMTLASYCGTSMLFGAFVGGLVLSRLPCIHPDAPFMVVSRQDGETQYGKTPNFAHTFEKYIIGGQTYILQPMFFASVGFAIPVKDLWSGTVLWKGATYAVLMLLSKVSISLVIPLYDIINRRPLPATSYFLRRIWQPSLIMGFGMVARGEIGLLTIMIGHNHTDFLTREAFIVGIWAIILNTMIGPFFVGLIMRRFGSSLARDPRWGLMDDEEDANIRAWDAMSTGQMSARGRWTNRMNSRSVSRAGSRTGSRSGSRNGSRPTTQEKDMRRRSSTRVSDSGDAAERGCAGHVVAVVPVSLAVPVPSLLSPGLSPGVSARPSMEQSRRSSDQAGRSSDQAGRSSDQAGRSSDQAGPSSDQPRRSAEQPRPNLQQQPRRMSE
ncbi:hypothetical protein CFO_g1937 [Ceratocystis platani]|uniref:Cation/H+ exchanger transmembrane domain-containing protein n=1 Tax=Ceratocystis fimbriata f. sp. platani TaxID=88771 RepID=A0A0F8BT27_CERFI|nr:hypothetical protein CFO_g1937 [Ceratocystis platani]